MKLSVPLVLKLLFGYCLLSCLFYAFVSGAVFDEPFYIRVGNDYWNHHLFEFSADHPPFSKWFGTLLLYPWQSDQVTQTSLFLCRLPHILLYCGVGVFIAQCLRKGAGDLAALIFAALYACSPSIKAVVGHHLTDADPGVFIVLGGILIWKLWTSPSLPEKWRSALLTLSLATFSVTLAALCKFTGLVFLPYYLVLIFWLASRLPTFESRRTWTLIVCCLTVGFTFLLAFHFRWDQIRYYRIGYFRQLAHHEAGHVTSFFGKLSSHGVKAYFPFVYFFKTSTPALILLLASLKKALSKEVLLFLLPGLGFLALVSEFGRINLGFRYLIPSALLLLTYTSLSFKSHEIIADWYGKKTVGVLALLSVAFLSDLYTCFSNDYLNYFNFLTPAPTRNFSDANNDWGQGIPLHLKSALASRAPAVKHVKLPFEFFDEPNDRAKSVTYQIGPTELGGLWGSPLSIIFRSLRPTFIFSGNEFFTVTKETLWKVLYLRGPEVFPIAGDMTPLDTPISPTADSMTLTSEPCLTENLVLKKKSVFDFISSPSPANPGQPYLVMIAKIDPHEHDDERDPTLTLDMDQKKILSVPRVQAGDPRSGFQQWGSLLSFKKGAPLKISLTSSLTSDSKMLTPVTSKSQLKEYNEAVYYWECLKIK